MGGVAVRLFFNKVSLFVDRVEPSNLVQMFKGSAYVLVNLKVFEISLKGFYCIFRRHLYQMPKLPQLAPVDVRDQRPR